MEKFANLQESLSKAFPVAGSPLVHCITNEITCETVANALLYVDAKPVMADDPREFPEFFQQSDSLLLNLGHISPTREEALLLGASMAEESRTPMVLDLVGWRRRTYAIDWLGQSRAIGLKLSKAIYRKCGLFAVCLVPVGASMVVKRIRPQLLVRNWPKG